MPTDSGERRPAKAQGVGMGGAHPPEPEQHLPCPRCDSTNTKFCYYNNYNLSQPRHFCKSCRRYWTQGGTLRNVPVGGATRKNAKRSRTATSSSNPSTSSATAATNPSSSTSSPAAALKLEIPSPPPGDAGLTGMTSSGSFTSLLSSQGCSPGFLALGGFGLGLGSGYEEMGFGLGRGAVWPYQEVGAVDGGHGVVGAGGCGGSAAVAPLSSGCSGWQLGGGGGGGGEGGFGDGAECGFAWPDLAISMSGKGFK